MSDLSHRPPLGPRLFVSLLRLCFPTPFGPFVLSPAAPVFSWPLCWQACSRSPSPSSFPRRCPSPARKRESPQSASMRQPKTSVLSCAELNNGSGKQNSDSLGITATYLATARARLLRCPRMTTVEATSTPARGATFLGHPKGL